MLKYLCGFFSFLSLFAQLMELNPSFLFKVLVLICCSKCFHILVTDGSWKCFSQQMSFLQWLFGFFNCFIFHFRSQPCKRGWSLRILAPQTLVCMRMRIWTRRSALNQKQNWITPAGTQTEMYFLIVAYVWLYCNAEFCIFILSVEKLAFFKYFKLLKSSAPDRYVLMMVPHYPSREILLKKAKMKAKKKPRRRSDSSGGYTLSDIIQSPPAAGRLQTQTQVIWFWNTSASGCWWVICYNYTVFPLSGLTAPSEVRQGELYRVSAGAAHIWFWGQLHGSGQSQRHSITHLSWQSWGKYLKFNETDMHTGCCQCIIKKISKQIFNLCLLWFFGIYMDRWIWYYRSQEKLSFIICRMKRLSVRG